MELPTFVSGINAMRIHGANVVGVEMDEEGMELNGLEHVFQTEPNVKMLYVIPTFQNPSGKTMSLARRKAIYALCVKYGVMILEDNPYGELRFRGEDIPTFKSMDDEGIVIYNGSYSKVLSAAAISLGNQLILDMEFVSGKRLCAVGEESLQFLDLDGNVTAERPL